MNLQDLTEAQAVMFLLRSDFLDYAVTGLVITILGGMLLGILINATFMLISPRAWAHLPRWLRFAGRVPASQHTSAWGRLELRLGGAATLGILALLFQAMIISHIPASRASHLKGITHAHAWQALSRFFGSRWLALSLALLMGASLAINGVFMLIWPQRWFSLPSWIRGRRGFAERILRSSNGTVLLRCSGALLLAADGLLAYSIITSFR